MIKKLGLVLLIAFLFVECKSKKIDPLTNGEVESILGVAPKSYTYDKKLTDEDKKYFADKLDVKVEEITNKKLYIFIKSWEETTYLYGGEDKNGIDCSALMQRLYKHVYNANLPRTAADMAFYKKIKLHDPVDELREGDLVFFRNNDEKLFSHVGVYLANDKFFAASSTDGCSISSLKKPYWKKYYKAFGRLKK
ncbi:C40 family peptidase [Flavobacterium sp.]|uniref:C40 family peptidase n=1 Tax=Flavobacterium sp. TaxID=239 RepID=UPI00286DD8D8|nr:C40 family peptidase [Flavobacterium sp.]